MLTHGHMHTHACGQPLMHIIYMVGHTEAQALPCTHAHVYTHTHMHTYTCTNIHDYTHVHMPTHVHSCAHTLTHVCTLMCTHAYGHAQAQPSSHMTHTHTNTFMALLGATFSPEANKAGKPPRRFLLALGYPICGAGQNLPSALLPHQLPPPAAQPWPGKLSR